MTECVPTFVVGVGGAGIESLQHLRDVVERNDDADRFDYVAVDTDAETLHRTPDGCHTVHLTAPTEFVPEDVRLYPYLTEDTRIGEKGTERQRPVGRYKLDSRGHPSFDDHFNTLSDAARTHLERALRSHNPRDVYNIFLLHSLGGGTGGGTFPLLLSVLDTIGETLSRQYGVEVSVSGVGMLPRVDTDPDIIEPPGSSVAYPNAYASLQDLSVLMSADSNTEDIQLYSRMVDSSRDRSETGTPPEASIPGEALPVDSTPFDNYWLVGVDEGRLAALAESGDVESYPEMVNYRVATSVHAWTQVTSSNYRWIQSTSCGCLGQSELRVPHGDVRAFCEDKQTLEETRTRIETVQQEIDDLRDEVAYVRTTYADPEELDPAREEIAEPRPTVRAYLESELGIGEGLVDSTAEELEATLSDVHDEHSPVVALLATEVLEEMLSDPDAAPAADDRWRSVVDEQWTSYGEGVPGRKALDTYESKADALTQYYRDAQTEYEERYDQTEPGIIDKIPPFTTLTESDRERFQRFLDELDELEEELQDVTVAHERVGDLFEAVQTVRVRNRTRLDDRLARLKGELQEREDEHDELQAECNQLRREVDERETLLTDNERGGMRLGILPIREEALSDLTLDRVENELTSLDAYVGELVDEDAVRVRLERGVERSFAWDDPIASRNLAGVATSPTTRELWVLSHEENESYAREFIEQRAAMGNTRLSGEGNLDFIGDPYTIEFVTFYKAGPVESFVQFQRLEQMRDSGMLDSMAYPSNDYRRCFAYPEWYGRGGPTDEDGTHDAT